MISDVSSEKEDSYNKLLWVGSCQINSPLSISTAVMSPTELLKVRSESVFTWPDFTSNKVYLAASNANFYLEDDSIINTSVYYRRLIRDTLNADELDAEELEP